MDHREYTEEEWAEYANAQYIAALQKGKAAGKGSKGMTKKPPNSKKPTGKGAGKASGGGAKQTPLERKPFFGKCRKCGVMGHPESKCPKDGKGFKGTCWNCGLPGHSEAICPYQTGGKVLKQKALNSVGDAESGGGATSEGSVGAVQAPTKSQARERTMFLGGAPGPDPYDKANCHVDLVNGWERPKRTFRVPQPRDMGMITPIQAAFDRLHEKVRDGRKHIGFCQSYSCDCDSEGKPQGTVDEVRFLKGGKVRITMDSGAIEHVMPAKVLTMFGLRESDMSRNGSWFTAAQGSKIFPEGERTISGATATGMLAEMTFQVCPGLTNILASVRRVCEAGNKVIMDDQGGKIINLASGDEIPLVLEQGVYYLELDVEDFRRRA